MEKTVELTGVTKQYANGRGIKNINLTVRQGDVVGILGPNGAGKTTLLKCLTGLIKPDQGKIELFGHDIEEQYKRAIRNVGACIGQGMMYDNMTAFQNLKMALRFYPDVPETSIDEVLELTGLTPYKYEKISSYSMGMKQRFGIATALISKPKLIILDEPTNGLDIDGLLLFRKTISQLASESDVTFLISSHHISEMERLCNRFCFLINGELSHSDSNEPSLEELYIKKVEEGSHESSRS
ncbi:ABC transporter ATP-binding protein [Bacillus marasmi]|uniref:ABC transporter ATP-binding protein n=1 Tax=Bacillus marasmi TaxID=1926279 RepID=UPI0011C9D032|nr:ABC transporter ATP-binding protein [Bacillus marasmi]